MRMWASLVTATSRTNSTEHFSISMQFKVETYQPIYQSADLFTAFLNLGRGYCRRPWPTALCER